MLNPQESGRLDAKRHHVILAKQLDGIYLASWSCLCNAVLRHDIMSLGIKPSAIFLFYPQQNKEFKLIGLTANVTHIWEKVGPIQPFPD